MADDLTGKNLSDAIDLFRRSSSGQRICRHGVDTELQACFVCSVPVVLDESVPVGSFRMVAPKVSEDWR